LDHQKQKFIYQTTAGTKQKFDKASQLIFGAFAKIGAEMLPLVSKLLSECVYVCPHVSVEHLNRFAQEIFTESFHYILQTDSDFG
jgi:hypothetical protein